MTTHTIYLSIYLSIYIYIYIYTYLHICIHLHIPSIWHCTPSIWQHTPSIWHMHTHTCIRITHLYLVPAHAHTYACTHECVHAYVIPVVCMCTCICILATPVLHRVSSILYNVFSYNRMCSVTIEYVLLHIIPVLHRTVRHRVPSRGHMVHHAQHVTVPRTRCMSMYAPRPRRMILSGRGQSRRRRRRRTGGVDSY